MDPQTKKIILAVIIALALVVIMIVLIITTNKCKPHCSGARCGSNSDDGCGGTCQCEKGGKCNDGICCYPNCDGLKWGDDGCGGKCTCNIIPGGVEETNGKCCYAQDCNNVYCGSDGCGKTCECLSGATCSEEGICANAGTSGWIWNIINSNGVARSNQSSPIACAGWLPQNVALNLTAFPCETDSDCPYGDKCVVDSKSKAKFCNRNDVYQWWYYDPADQSGYNCTKIRQGSDVCGLPKPGAAGFDIIGNKGPDASKCNGTCTIDPICPKSGPDSCCPEDWALKGKSAQCVDQHGVGQCCLNNPDLTGYSDCTSLGLKDCATVGGWWKGNLGEIANGVCGNSISGPALHVNPITLQDPSWVSPCEGKNPGDICDGSVGSTTYSGICRTCSDGEMRCFPDETCVATSVSAAVPGICSSQNLCSN